MKVAAFRKSWRRQVCCAAVVGVGLVYSVTHAVAERVILTEITAPWRYTTNTLGGVSWADPVYDDSGWSGPGDALLYIGTNALPAPKNTPLPPRPGGGPWNTYYFRSSLEVTNIAGITFLTFSNLVDDGAVFYLNGTEIQRIGMPEGTITRDTTASRTIENADAYEVFFLCGEALTNLAEGHNLLAVEVHQHSNTNADVAFGSAVSAYYGEAPAEFTRGPYLQLSTPTGIVIRWRTTFPTGSRVVYGTNLAFLGATNRQTLSTTEHVVPLANLVADTTYFYQVGGATTVLAEPETNHFFRTNPLPGTEKPIRVWVIGDAGTAAYGGLANQLAVRDAFQAYNGTNTVHAWLQLGDNAYNYGTDADYQIAVFDVYTNLLRTSVTWPTFGNHETYGGAPYPYFSIFTLPTAGEAGGAPSGTEHYYSFNLGMVHFICLDSMLSSRALDGAMAEWLRWDLEMNTNRWTIAYWHHPPYTKGSHDSDNEADSVRRMADMRENILPLLEAGGVDLVLSGHSHCYERSYLIDGHYGFSDTFDLSTMVVQPGNGRETNGVGAYLKPDRLGERPMGHRGTVYAVVGCSGQTSGGTLDHPAMYTSQNVLGSMVLDFASNRLDAVFLRADGNITDRFSIIKDDSYPPVLTESRVMPNGEFQFSVLTRPHRTNVIEIAETLSAQANWTAVATNISDESSFDFQDTNASPGLIRFYRVRQP